jgi:hypothetical protein
MINGKQYEFADVSLLLAGRDVTGFRGINYKSAQEKEHMFAKGNKPISIQRGNISHTGTLFMTGTELETLKRLGGGSVLGLNLNAVVSYGNPSLGDDLVTDTIIGIEFTEEEKEYKQGDKFAEFELPFLALDIKYQSNL